MSSAGKIIGIAIVSVIIIIGLGIVIGDSDTEVSESTDSTVQEVSELSGVVNIGLILPKKVIGIGPSCRKCHL